VTSSGLRAPFDVAIHHSSDGMSFVTRPLAFTVDGTAPHAAELMAVDPRDSDVIYVRAFVTVPGGDGGRSMPLQVLLRSTDGGVSVTELHRVVGEQTPAGATRGIDGVAVDPGRGRVYVATSKGLFAGPDGATTLTPTGGLSQAQCAVMKGDVLYVCSTNYSPDFKALARSDDGGESFQSVLSYQATVGPRECPKGTPGGDECPIVWTTYAAQLGIENAPDGGTTGGGDSCDCSLGRRARTRAAGSWVFAAGLLFAGRYLLTRRRRRA
jgi:hypothetical protein